MKNFRFLIVVCILFGLTFNGLGQGQLTPPATGPEPTMKSLDQIEPRIPVDKLNSAPPYSITQSGHYYLTGDIDASSGIGILIDADDVVIDLNGFKISNGAPCIEVGANRSGVTIQNGFLESASACLHGRSESRIRCDDLTFAGQGDGLNSEGGFLVQRCQFKMGNSGIAVNAISDGNGQTQLEKKIINSSFHGGDRGVNGSHGGTVSIHDSVFLNQETNAVYIANNGQLLMDRCQIRGGDPSEAILLEGDSQAAFASSINHTTISRIGGYGIVFSGHLKVNQSLIEDCNQAGLFQTGDGSLTISNSSLLNNSEWAYQGIANSDMKWDRVQIRSENSSGVSLLSASSNTISFQNCSFQTPSNTLEIDGYDLSLRIESCQIRAEQLTLQLQNSDLAILNSSFPQDVGDMSLDSRTGIVAGNVFGGSGTVSIYFDESGTIRDNTAGNIAVQANSSRIVSNTLTETITINGDKNRVEGNDAAVDIKVTGNGNIITKCHAGHYVLSSSNSYAPIVQAGAPLPSTVNALSNFRR